MSIKRILRRTVCLAAGALLLGVGVTVAAPQWVLPPVASALDVSESPRPVDFVLVLNGDPQTRPFAAAALVKSGLARTVLLSPQRANLESATVQDGILLTELDMTRRILRTRGVPDDAVHVLPGAIASTFDEAHLLADFLAEQPDATVAVVTNGFHTRRARWIFRRVLAERADQLTFVGVPRDGVDAAAWWRTEKGWVVYLSEWSKLGYYQLCFR